MWYQTKEDISIHSLLSNYLHISLISVTDHVTNSTKFVIDSDNYTARLGVICLLLSFSVPTFLWFLSVLQPGLFCGKLRQSADFRKSTAVIRSKKILTKEKTVSTIALGICVIYIVCFSPNVATILASTAFRNSTFSIECMETLL